MRRPVALTAIGVLLTVAAGASPLNALATQPGQNGRIVFVRTDHDTGGCPSGTIWTMRPDGSQERDLAGSIDLGVVGGVAWSPDGKRLAFTVQTSIHEPLDVMGVLVMDADGSNKRGLQNIPVHANWRCDPSGPTWSPDGTRVAVAGVDRIYTVEVGGSFAVTRLTAGAPDLYDQPAWSPDGASIAVRIPARGVIGVNSRVRWRRDADP